MRLCRAVPCRAVPLPRSRFFCICDQLDAAPSPARPVDTPSGDTPSPGMSHVSVPFLSLSLSLSSRPASYGSPRGSLSKRFQREASPGYDPNDRAIGCLAARRPESRTIRSRTAYFSAEARAQCDRFTFDRLSNAQRS